LRETYICIAFERSDMRVSNGGESVGLFLVV